jgi:hypothetical protein
VLVPRYSSGNLYLYDSYAGVYAVPHSVPALLSGSTASLGTAALGLHLVASSPNSAYGFTPYTNAQTSHGLPSEEASSQSNLSQDNGPPTGGSQTSTRQPTTVLITIAGRDPADITIRTQAGTQCPGGPSGSGSNLVVVEDATPQGPSMRAAPPEGMIAGAWSSLRNWAVEFFTKDAAVEAEQAIDPVEKLDAQLRNTLWNKLYHHPAKSAYRALDKFVMSLHSDPAPAIQSAFRFIGRSHWSNFDGFMQNAQATNEIVGNFTDWYNGASDWEKKDFVVESYTSLLLAEALGKLTEGVAPNTLASTSQGKPMDPARFLRIKNAFERQRAADGGFKVINQSAQAQYELFEAGVVGQTGLTISADEVLMVPNPTSATVFDEMIHTAQFRRGLVQQAEVLYGKERAITHLEILVQEKLLQNASAYGITAEETSSIQSRLQRLYRTFNAGH